MRCARGYARTLPRLAGGLLLAAALAGCTAAHYRRAADKDVYRIVQDVEKQIFGTTNNFTIDTPYSSRDPKSILPDEIIADRGATNLRVIDLEEALRLAFVNSREYQTQKEQLYLSALSLTGARYEFSPQFFARSTASIAGTGNNLDDSVLLGTDVGVSQFLKTGGQLSAALANDIVLFYTGNQPRQVLNMLSINVAQPLLRGFGRNDPTVEALTQATRNVIYSVRSFNLYQQEFAVGIVEDYFRLLTQKDQIRNNFTDYTNRIETVRYYEARAVDRETASSVDDARTQELESRNRYINSLAAFLNQLDVFKLQLGIPVSERIFLDDADLRELIQQGEVPVEIGRDAAFAMALDKQMNILNAIDRFEDSKRRIRVAADQFMPGLNLAGNMQLPSEPPDDYMNFELDKVRYSASLQLDLPVDRLRARNAYRQTLISFESQIRSLSLTLDSYRDRIDRGLRSIEEARLNLVNGLEQLRVAERRLDNERMRLEAGRNTVRDLREAQDNLIIVQNRMANLYTSYLSARLGLLLNAGVLDINPPKFWLRDPITAQLTPEQRGTPPLRMPDNAIVPPETFLEPSS